MFLQLQHRRDTAANWLSANPVLADGEFGLEKDTFKYKFGDGVTHWDGLPYVVYDTTALEVKNNQQDVAIAALQQSSHFEHAQTNPLAMWTVNHNFGFRPSVKVLSVGGIEMLTENIHVSVNQVLIYFDNPMSGLAICS